MAGRVTIGLPSFRGGGVVDDTMVVEFLARVGVMNIFAVNCHVVHAVVYREL